MKAYSNSLKELHREPFGSPGPEKPRNACHEFWRNGSCSRSECAYLHVKGPEQRALRSGKPYGQVAERKVLFTGTEMLEDDVREELDSEVESIEGLTTEVERSDAVE